MRVFGLGIRTLTAIPFRATPVPTATRFPIHWRAMTTSTAMAATGAPAAAAALASPVIGIIGMGDVSAGVGDRGCCLLWSSVCAICIVGYV